MHEKLVTALKRAEEAEALAEHRGRLVMELEETVKRVNKELETVSVDLDLAAVSQALECLNLKRIGWPSSNLSASLCLSREICARSE